MVSMLDLTYFTPITYRGASAANSSNGTSATNSSTGVNSSSSSNSSSSANSSSTVNSSANTNDVTAPASDDYQAQFEAKLGLIKKYCSDYIILDENGDEINVDAIRIKYQNDYEAGVKYCDELINTFDHDKVEKLVKSQYKQRVDANIENGKTVADQWVKSISESGTTAATISTSNVNGNNILDVMGAFVTNEDVKNGKVNVSQLFEDPNTAEALVSAIKSKAQSFIKRTDLDSSVKETIIAQTNELVDARYDYSDSDTEKLKANRTNLVNKYMTLFETLRTEQGKLDDAAAPKYYGLPDSFGTTITTESDRASEEVKAYKSRKRLNTNF
jgi:hypothetical protein